MFARALNTPFFSEVESTGLFGSSSGQQLTDSKFRAISKSCIVGFQHFHFLFT